MLSVSEPQPAVPAPEPVPADSASEMQGEVAAIPEVPPLLEPPPEPPAEVEPMGPVPPAVDPSICQPPSGVSGRPRNLSQAISLINSLPRPTTLPCFLQALERPLQVYMTRSDQSLQPSPGARSPRTFIVNEPLVMSIVFEGDAQVTLELGYRTAEARSIKTELVFPLRSDVTVANMFDEVMNGRVTRCSACHTSESELFNDEIQANVFESDTYAPFEVYEVDVESVRGENASCDKAAEPARCALLSALFDHGDVVPAPQGIQFSL